MAQQPTPRDQLEHLLGIARRSLRYAWVAAIIAVVGIAATLAFALLHTPAYRSETVLLYREVIPTNLLRDISTGNRHLAGQFREMLTSRPLLEPIVDELQPDPGVVESRGMTAAVEELRNRIEFRDGGGNTFRIGFTGSSPELAQKVTEQLASRLVEWQKQIQLEAVSVTKEFLENERLRAEAKLSEAEYSMAEFLAAHPEFAFEIGQQGAAPKAGASIRAAAESKLAAKAPAGPAAPARPGMTQLSALERQRERVAARIEQLKQNPEETVNPEPLPPTPELAEALRELDSARRYLEEKQAEFTEKHPDVIRATRQVEEATRRVSRLRAAQAAAKPARAPRDPVAEAALLSAELAGLDEQIAELKRRQARVGVAPAAAPAAPAAPAGETTGTADKKKAAASASADAVVKLEAEWARLLRETQERRERYSSIESTSYSAEIVAASEVARSGTQLTVLDPAYLPTRPAGTPRRLIAMFGGLVVCCLAFAVAAGLGLVDDQISSRRDLEGLGVGAVLVVVPREKRKRRVDRG